MTIVGADQVTSTASARIVAWENGRWTERQDTLAGEEPLEIRLAGCSVAVTMRTPGHDFDLAAGFLLTEGIIHRRDDIVSMAHCPADQQGLEIEPNIVNVNPSDPALVDPDRWRRNFFATSSCGICGKASIESVRQEAPAIRSEARISDGVILRLEAQLREAQAVFSQTGGLHAAALFDLRGHMVLLREDVGRHNAVDKVIGAMLHQDRLPLDGYVLLVSGRTSFEIMQKALMAGIPIVVAVSAPSSLAVELARESNMTLVGFLRYKEGQGRFNVYAGAERIVGAQGAAIV